MICCEIPFNSATLKLRECSARPSACRRLMILDGESQEAALTTAQARQLIAQAIEEEVFPLRNVLAILHYRQRRNYAAYCTHRKRTLDRLRQTANSRKRKTS